MKKVVICIIIIGIFTCTNAIFALHDYHGAKPLRDSGAGGSYVGGKPQNVGDNAKISKEIKDILEQIVMLNKARAETIGAIVEFQKSKQEALKEMISEGGKVSLPEYMPKPPKMYDHVPTADEVYKDMSPSVQFHDSDRNIKRLQKELETYDKELEKLKKKLEKLQKQRKKLQE